MDPDDYPPSGGAAHAAVRTPYRPVRRLLERSAAAQMPALRLAARVAGSVVRRKVPNLSRATVRIDHTGTVVHADLKTPFGLGVYRYGFSPPEARLVRSILRPGDVFIDGGANVGLFSLVAAAAVGRTGRVVACEPVPETMALLQENVAVNRFGWVETHKVALGERSGQAELFSFGAGAGLSSFAPATRVGTLRLLVDVECLDAISFPYRSRVRLVKLDIEGAEVKALLGAQRLLTETPDFLIEVEPEHLARQGSRIDQLEAIFAASGYQSYEIKEEERQIVLIRMEQWRRPTHSPNVFVSARASATLPYPVRRD